MKKFLLPAIFVLGLCLRLFFLSNHPAGFTPDEASFGYDAYSILKTGKDQWGKTMPIQLESFGDFKLPLYSYLAIPSVAVFGLNEFAVRFPNALLGSFSVLATYVLVKKWLGKENIALLSSLLLAISPWHVMMSRGAFEANLTTLLLPLGIYLFMRGLDKSKYFIFAAVIFGFNIFTYHAARIVTPLVLAALILSYWKELKISKTLVTSLVVFWVFLVVAVLTMLTGGGSRLQTAGIFNFEEAQRMVADDRLKTTTFGSPEILSKTFKNKYVFVAKTFVTNYLSYYSFPYLFTEGVRESTYGMIPGMGNLYLVEIVFLVAYIAYLAKNFTKKHIWFLTWLIVSPIPAAITKGPGHAGNRSIVMLPALLIAVAIGLVYLFKVFKDYKKPLVVATVSIYTLSFIYFVYNYLYTQPITGGPGMMYGIDKALEKVDDQKYEKIIVSRSVSEPHAYVYFYKKLDPRFVQKETRKWNYQQQNVKWVDQMGEYNLGKYVFTAVDNYDPGEKVLRIGRPDEFRSTDKIIDQISNPDGTSAWLIVE